MMRLAHRLVALGVCGVFLVSALAAPAQIAGYDRASAQTEYTLYVGTLQDPGNLNPFSMVLSMAYTISFLMYDTLNSVEPDLSFGPQLAESWYHNEDGTVWYYNITKDAYWHDNEPVTAHDVAFTFNLVNDNKDVCTLWIDYLRNMTEAVALDDYTVRVTTEVPKATMLSIMVPILPKHVWELIPVDKLDKVDYWRDSKYFPNGPVGSGPFKLDSYVTDDYIKMLTWDSYYIDTANFDVLVYKIFSSPDSMLNALYSADIDVATSVPTTAWTATLEKSNIDGQAVKALTLFELGVNCMPEYWREGFTQASDNLEMLNRSVRQAIAMCVDKDYIVNTILGGLADPGESLIPTATDQWHYDVPEEDEFDFDIEEAKRLLDAAGYRDEDGDGTRENVTSGVELADLIFYYRSDATIADQRAAEKISEWLAQAGIDAPAVGVTENSLYTYWYQAKYDLYIWAWDTDVDPSFMLSVMTTDQIPETPQDWTAWSDCFYSNPVYDALFVKQQNTVDFEERQSIIFEMQSMLYEDCPYIVLWYPYGLYAYRTDTYFNYPDMVKYPGKTPGTMWFFFEIMPFGANLPPYDVDAGADQDAEVGQTLTFTGSATDPNPDDVLTYEWTFVEPDDSETTKGGQIVDYTFENVGTVGVTLVVTDGGGLSASDSLVVTVTEREEGSGWVEGYVKDGAGAPVLGASVTVGTKSQSTDVAGHFNMSIVAGNYTVQASKTGFASASEDVTVLENLTSWVNLTLDATAGTVQGTVRDADTGEPLAEASVRIDIGSSPKILLTNSTGGYKFTGIEEGTYDITVSASGYVTDESTVVVEAGETTTKDFMLAPEKGSGGGGISSLALLVGALVLVVLVAAVALTMFMKRKKASEPPPPSGE